MIMTIVLIVIKNHIEVRVSQYVQIQTSPKNLRPGTREGFIQTVSTRNLSLTYFMYSRLKNSERCEGCEC